jgi:2-polyprenyl-3-methyl-5-hydroxy-6-metoxy-1,4-benzoquinol methylase
VSSKYDTEVNLSDRNNSHTLMVELIGSNRDVLDVGCANGYLGSVLKERGCTVVGVEIDAEAAEDAREVLDEIIVASVEEVDLVELLGAGRFDVVVFGDVLEHLRDPLPPLRQARRLLKPGGYVVISIPNVAHGSVRLSLLRGEFPYRSLGLLDNTHLRFFTRQTVEELLDGAGLAAAEILRTTAGIFDTELGIKPGDFPAQVVRSIEADPEATTYQFVVKAVVDDADHAVRLLQEQVEVQQAEIERLRAGAAAASAPVVEPPAAVPSAVPAPAERPVAPRVALAGTFDLDDVRTALVLRVVQAELARRLPGASIRAVAPYGYLRPSRHDGGAVVEPLRSGGDERAAALAEQFDALVVTGELSGRHQLAARYGDTAETAPADILTSGLGPHEGDCPVIWAGVTLAADTEPDELVALARVLEQRRWPGSVVNDDTLVRLQAAGTGPVEVVPDPVFLTPRVFRPDVVRRRTEYLQALGWLSRSGSALIVQAGADHVPFAPAVASALTDWIAVRPDTTIVVAELAPGDEAFAEALTHALTVPTLRFPRDATIEDVVAALAGAGGFIGTSALALAVSMAYGRPHVGLDLTRAGALDSFARTSGNSRAYVTDAELIVETLAAAPAPAHLVAVAAGIWGSLDAHFDELARRIAEAARERRGHPAPAAPSDDYVAALEAAHRALQQRVLTERAYLAHRTVAAGGHEVEAPQHQLWHLQKELETLQAKLEHAQAELLALRGTRMFRTLQPARRVYGRLRGLPK